MRDARAAHGRGESRPQPKARSVRRLSTELKSHNRRSTSRRPHVEGGRRPIRFPSGDPLGDERRSLYQKIQKHRIVSSKV